MFYDIKSSSERIRKLRIENGFTQEAIAEMLNIDRSYYGRVEIGKKGCSVDLFIQLSTLFNVSLDYLILGKYRDTVSESTDRTQLKKDLSVLITRLEQFKTNL